MKINEMISGGMGYTRMPSWRVIFRLCFFVGIHKRLIMRYISIELVETRSKLGGGHFDRQGCQGAVVVGRYGRVALRLT